MNYPFSELYSLFRPILFLISTVNIVSSVSNSNGCYLSSPDFREILVDNFDPNTLTHKICQGKCGSIEFPYAMIESGQFCFCGNDTIPDSQFVSSDFCDIPCPGDSTEFCGSENYFILTLSTPKIEVYLDQYPGIFCVGEAQNIQIESVIGGSDVQFSFDFGDESPTTQYAPANASWHVYTIPGEYYASVTAFDGIMDPFTDYVKVSAEMRIAGFSVNCSGGVKSNGTMDCSFSIIAGSNMWLEFDIEDLSYENPFPISDPRLFGVGIAVPQYDKEIYNCTDDLNTICNINGNEIFIFPGSEATDTGFIITVEVYISEVGDGTFTILILKPYCKNNTLPYCAPENLCTSSCDTVWDSLYNPLHQDICENANQTFCLESKRCVNSENATEACSLSHVQRHNVYEGGKGEDPRTDYLLWDLIEIEGIGRTENVLINLQDSTLPENFVNLDVGFVLGVSMTPGGAKLGFKLAEDGDPVEYSYKNQADVNENDLKNRIFSKAGSTVDGLAIKHYLRVIASDPSVTILSQQLPADGSFLVQGKVANQLDGMGIEVNTTVEIQYEVSGLKANISGNIFAVGDEVMVVLSVEQGYPVLVTFDWGDDVIDSITDYPLFYNKSYTGKHFYSKGNFFIVQVSAFNYLSNTIAYFEIEVQQPVMRNYQLTSDSPVNHPFPGFVKYTITFSELGSDDPLATGAMMIISWGDTENTDVLAYPFTDNGETWNITHYFRFTDIYETTLIIYNLISQEEFSITVGVYEAIGNLGLSLWYNPPLPLNGDSQPGNGEEKNIFPSNIPVIFEGTYDTGTGLNFTYDFNGSIIETVENPFIYSFQLGTYQVSMWASNPLNSEGPVLATVIMYESIEGIEIKIAGQIRINKPMYFNLKVSQVGTNSCIVIDYGDLPTILDIYGVKEICQSHSDYNNSIWRGEISESVLLSHNYSYKNSFKVNVHGFNLASYYDAELNFAISEVNCEVPKITIQNDHPDWRGPLKVYKNNSFFLKSTTVLNCAVTFSNFKQWWVEQIDPITGEVLSGTKIKLYELTEGHKYYVEGANSATEIKIPAGLLQPNRYKFSYKVTMDDSYTFGDIVSSYVEEYVDIYRSPLEVSINKGQTTQIEKGDDQQFNLEPELYSFDPDMDSIERNKNFTFLYFCRQLYEEWPLNDDREFDRLAFVEYPPSSNGSAVLGGCFGDGPGRLNHSSGSLTVSTKYMATGMSYFFFIIVEKDERSSNTSLTVTIVQGNPPELSISCASGTGCIATDSGQMINPSYNQRFISRCLDDCSGKISYIWEVQGFREDTQKYEDLLNTDIEKYMTGLTHNELYVSTTFFSNYTEFKQYKFVLFGLKGDGIGANGTSNIVVYINSPPQGENCSVSPNEGVTGIDIFNVTCHGWYDNDGISNFQLYHVESNIKSQLAFDIEPVWELYMPQGDIQLLVKITDVYDAATEYLLPVIKVIPPPFSKADAIFDSMLENGYEEIKAAGNSKDISSIVARDASICNYLASKKTEISADIEKRTMIREELIHLCESVPINTLENVELVASALFSTSKIPDEVSLSSSLKQAQMLDKMTDLIRQEVFNLNSPPEKIMQSAIGVIACTGNIIESISQYSAILFSENSTKTISNEDFSKIKYTVNLIVEQPKRLSEGILWNSIAGEPAKLINTGAISLSLQKNTLEAMKGKDVLMTGKGAIKIPSFPPNCPPGNTNISLLNCTENTETLNFEASEMTSNPYVYSNSSSKVSADTSMVTLDLRDSSRSTLSVGPTNDEFEIEIPRISEEPPWIYYQPSADANPEFFMFHSFNITQKEVSISLELRPDIESYQYAVYMAYNRQPNSTDYDWKALLPNNMSLTGKFDLVPSPYTLFIDNYEVLNRTNQTLGKFVIGVQELDWTDRNRAETFLSGYPPPRDFTANYSVRIYTSACLFWDENLEEFSSDGCRVGPMTRVGYESVTQCFCNHLTSFVSGFVVPPNNIDFSYVFANMDFTQNLTIYITTIVVFVIYFIGVIWARRKDIKDLETLGVTPLADNDLLDTYFYEIVVYTGQRKNAGTDSVVRFILSGEEDDTGVRSFTDDKRKIFRRGAVDRFLLAVPESLGQLNFIRLWHDNSGRGKMQGWYLNYIEVKDLQTPKKYFFIANQWFSIVEDDGQIDRSIHVAGKEQIQNFEHVFSSNTRKAFEDGHMWFSILFRPPQSRFTRVQRISCCLMALWLEMLTNIMFYETIPPPSSGSAAISLGPFSFTIAEIAIGIESSLIVFPISLITVQLFRKSRPRKKRQSRFEKAHQATKERQTKKYVFTIDQGQEKQDLYRAVSRAESLFENHRPPSALSPSRISIQSRMSVAPSPLSLFNFEEQKDIERCFDKEDLEPRAETSKDANNSIKKSSQKKKKKSKDIPHFCVYIAWFLVFLGVSVSVTFVLFYAVSMGDSKTRQWFTSMIISFITSVFFTQPIKVILIAILIALICKKIDEDEEGEEDEEDCKLADDEELLHSKPKALKSKKKQRTVEFQPPSLEELEEARKTRLKELEMFSILREILFYSFFLILLMVLTYSSTDKNSFTYKTSLLNHVATGDNTKFEKITNLPYFWKWIEEILLPGLYTKEWYNGQMPADQDGYISDRASIVLGYPVIRQLRILPGECDVEPAIEDIIQECNVQYSIFDQDEGSYGAGWTKNLTMNETIPNEYFYTPAAELDSYPYWGKHATYPGGGYIAKLDGNLTQSVELLQRLKENLWIDRYSRAIFIEFSLYNSQINLFGSVILLIELLATGGVFASSRVDSLRLLTYQTSFSLIQIVCEICFVFFLVFYLFKEVNNFRRTRKKKEYFVNFWSLVEISTLSFGIALVAIFAYRQYEIFRILSKLDGVEYIKLQYAAYWDENFKILTGVMVFMSTLKFLKLLRFNMRISILSATLKRCSVEIMNFLLIFGIFFLGFSVLFYLLFNMLVYDFSDIIFTAESLLVIIMGKFRFQQLAKASPVFGPIAFFFFILTITFILINMFVTILNEGFGSVKKDMENKVNEYEILDFVIGRFKNMVGLTRPENDTTIRINMDDELIPNVLALEQRLDCLVKSIARVHYDYQDEDLAALDWIDDYEINYNEWTDKKKGTGNSVKKVNIYLSDQ